MKKAIKLTIKGSVQGVFFRNFVKENADKFKVNGFVRNLESGHVEVFAEGDIDNVDKLVEICSQGPKHAEIKDVNVKESPFQDFQEFKILHI